MSQQCPHCRFHIPDGAIVCGHCGAERRTIVTEPYNPENIAGLIPAVLGLFVGAFIGWKLEKSFKYLFLGAVLGLIIGFWLPLVKKLIYGFIGAAIGVFIGAVIAMIFSWGGVIVYVCAVIGFFMGYFHEETEVIWER